MSSNDGCMFAHDAPALDRAAADIPATMASCRRDASFAPPIFSSANMAAASSPSAFFLRHSSASGSSTTLQSPSANFLRSPMLADMSDDARRPNISVGSTT